MIETDEKKMANMINHSSPLPLYHQVAQNIQNRIKDGYFKVNSRLPSEVELISEFGVSQPVVRQALNILVQQGLLVRERGRGTFVRPHSLNIQTESKVIKYRRIGFVLPWGPGTFFSPLLEAIEDVAHHNEFHVILANNREDAQVEITKIRELLKHGIDGLIWVCPSSGPNEAYARTIQKSIPAVVAVDRSLDLPDFKISLVQADNVNGMKKIVNYLISKGRTKIALIREPGTLSSIIDREKGFIEAMQESYLGFDPACIFKSRQSYLENGKLCASKIVGSKVKYDAIICMVDTTAIGVIQELGRRGISVPGDIAVTGFGDEPSALMVMPHLTTAKIDVKKMGSTAAELLLKQLDKLESGQTLEPIDTKIPVEIVIRDSA